MQAFPDFTGAFYGRRPVCGLLTCWDKVASPSTKYHFALAFWPRETYSGLGGIKSGSGVSLCVKNLATGGPIAAITRPPRHERASTGLKFPDWAAATAPFVPGTEVANRGQSPLAIPTRSSLSNADVLVSEATFPLKLAPSELSESMLVPLVNQFGLMQQQMFDQFQQAMAMMVQMFGTMHREQMEVIRAELDGLRDLTDEFQTLKKELASRTQERDATLSSAPAIAATGLDGSIPTESSASARATTSGVVSGLKASQPDASSVTQPSSMASSVPEQQSSSRPGVSPRLPSSGSPVVHASSEEFRGSDLRTQAKTNGTSDPADSERDSIIWLHQRIMTVQRERETRWQKILKLLPGTS